VNILLLSCYELGHQPLGLAFPQGFLHAAGFRTTGVDLSVDSLVADQIQNADFVGISVPMHTAMRIGMKAADRIHQENPRAKICFYGLYAGLNGEHLFEHHHADFVIGGEIEEPLVDLVRALNSGSSGEGISGAWTRTTVSPPYLQRVLFAPPQRSGLPELNRYAHLVHRGKTKPAAAVEASRGCKQRCLHCPNTPIYNGRFFVVPEEIVLGDIRAVVSKGAEHITFADPDFLNGPKHSLHIARAMHREFPALTFDFTTKIEHILRWPGYIPELSSLGGLFVVSAVESLSDTVLRNLEKGHTRGDVDRALEIVRDAEMTLRPSLLPFTPWSTLEDYVELLDWIGQEDLMDCVDPIQLTIRLLIPPGSALLWRKEILPYLGDLSYENLAYDWKHPDRRMDELQDKAWHLVNDGISSGEDASSTLEKIRSAVDGMVGTLAPPPFPALRRDRIFPPRLTESWFCCSEPREVTELRT